MAYWFVMQGNLEQDEEIDGGYLLAPKPPARHDKYYWSNLEMVEPNDLIFGYKRGWIRSLIVARGRVELVAGRATWTKSKMGRRVSARYRDLMKPLNIAELDPRVREQMTGYHQVFNKDGSPNNGYLFEVPDRAAERILFLIGADLAREFVLESEQDGFAEDVAAELPPERRVVVRDLIKRNRALVKELKKKHQYTCEECAIQSKWLTSDGTPYVEAHHLIPLGEDGSDDLRNLVILCAECHRMFHHGSKRSEQTRELIVKRSVQNTA